MSCLFIPIPCIGKRLNRRKVMYHKKIISLQEILPLSHQICPHFVGYLLNIKAFLDNNHIF